uniref:Cullin N-terminal domain-containing protein n=1 Tax=Acrobeloides nanus TaxID=290746 RepID=A0A914CZF9_9BILA
MEQEGGMSIPKYAFNIYLDLCKTCRNKKLYGVNKIKNELNDAISLAGDLMRQPWYSDDVRRNPFWHKNYSKEMYASFSDLWARLEKNLFEVFNNGLELRNLEEMTKILYTLYYIKPILSRRLKMQNKVLMIINKYLEAFFGAFMNRVRTIECVKKDQEFLVKYARLWLLFLRGTMILDHIFGKFEEDLLGTNRASYAKLTYNRKTKNFGGEAEQRDLTTYPCLAMNAWRETFFNGLNNRLVSVVVSLMEKERNGEFSATSTIPIELVQSFKLLDGFRQKTIWTSGFLEYLDHYSLLIGVDKLDLDQRLHQLSPTMMDHYNVMKYFTTFIYSFVQRPLALAVDNLLKLPSPTEVEVQQIIDSITAWKPDKNEANNTFSMINTRKKSNRRKNSEK